MELINRKRGTDLKTTPIDEEKWLFSARIPWAEVVTDFHDQLKNITAGYGSLDTSPADPPLADADLRKVDIMLNSEVVEPLAFVCHKDAAQAEARAVCKKVRKLWRKSFRLNAAATLCSRQAPTFSFCRSFRPCSHASSS
jgi:GTP-binding protein LepA